MTLRFLLPIGLVILWGAMSETVQADPLWSAVDDVEDLGEIRGFRVSLEKDEAGKSLVLTGGEIPDHPYRWVTIPVAGGARDLSASKQVRSLITNEGAAPVEVMLWVVGVRGWSAVGSFAGLREGESQTFACELQETFPDGTAKLNPSEIGAIQVMVRSNRTDWKLRVGESRAFGEASDWIRPRGRLEIPEVKTAAPEAGSRVVYRLPGESSSGIYGLLYLPTDWEEGKRYPVIVEYPGNIFFNRKCYSTGRPEQCDMGYGMSEGRGAIWLSLPFIDRERDMIVENGFGNADDTAGLCQRAVEDVIDRFGGDRDQLFLTGFSRGSIACGYIGLRNPEIASLWKGIHGCQHYDGSDWRESDLAGAVKRAERFRGVAIYQTDNRREKYQPVVEATSPDVEWTWDQSGLGFHATAMFLDDRPSTLRLREWFRRWTGVP